MFVLLKYKDDGRLGATASYYVMPITVRVNSMKEVGKSSGREGRHNTLSEIRPFDSRSRWIRFDFNWTFCGQMSAWISLDSEECSSTLLIYCTEGALCEIMRRRNDGTGLLMALDRLSVDSERGPLSRQKRLSNNK